MHRNVFLCYGIFSQAEVMVCTFTKIVDGVLSEQRLLLLKVNLSAGNTRPDRLIETKEIIFTLFAGMAETGLLNVSHVLA